MSARFHAFKVYQDAIILHHEIVQITKDLPKDFYYLKDQVRRSSLSPILNIAEGSAKSSDKDFNRYLENSMGSANETIAALDVMLHERLITQDKYDQLTTSCQAVINQLGGFSKVLRKK